VAVARGLESASGLANGHSQDQPDGGVERIARQSRLECLDGGLVTAQAGAGIASHAASSAPIRIRPGVTARAAT